MDFHVNGIFRFHSAAVSRLTSFAIVHRDLFPNRIMDLFLIFHPTRIFYIIKPSIFTVNYKKKNVLGKRTVLQTPETAPLAARLRDPTVRHRWFNEAKCIRES